MAALDLIEKGFINQKRGSAASDHQDVLKKTLNLMTILNGMQGMSG